MIWFTLALFAVSFVLTALLAPKPKFENARPQGLDELRFPMASDGAPIALALGRVRLRAPNTLWYGNFSAEPIIERGPRRYGFFGPRARITVGFKYRISIDLGLCLGPDVRLRRIWIDKEEVWSGNVGPGEASISINKPELFGGEKQGGGFSGTLRFYGGGTNQPANAHVAGVIGDQYPAYVGQSHIVLENCYIGTSAQLRPMSFEVERYTNSLGLSSENQMVGLDLNPMEVLFTMLTARWGMLGVDPNAFDISSLSQAAPVLAEEGNGMSLLVTSTNQGKAVLEEVLRQVDGIMYQDPATGEIVFRLIREDYDIGELPVFGPAQVAKVQTFTRGSWQDTINQVRVQFTNRDRKYETSSALEQDMANINMQGRLRSATISFPGAMTPQLASQLAAREISQLCVPFYSATLELNRRAGQLRPGDPFILNWPEYNIASLVMRVSRFNLGELIDGKVVIEASQDSFSSRTAIFAPPEDSGWTPIIRQAEPIVDARAFEAPFFLAANFAEGEGVALESNEGYFMNLAAMPAAGQFGFSTRVEQPAVFSEFVQGVSEELFTRTARLSAAIGRLDGFATGTVSSVAVSGVTDGSSMAALLGDATVSEQRTGTNLFVLNGELMSYQTASNLGGGEWTLNNVRRALADTNFEAHSVDNVLFFLDEPEAVVPGPFNAVAPMTFRFQGYTDRDRTPWEDALVVPLTPSRRAERPIRPAFIQVNGSRSPATITSAGNIEVTWRRRARSASSLAFENDADQGAITDVTYTLRVFRDDVIQNGLTQTGLTGTTATVAIPTDWDSIVRIELEAVHGPSTLVSRTQASIEFNADT